MKVSPEMGEGGSQEQECRQNKAQLINSLQVVNKKLAIMIMVIMTMVPMKMLLLLKLIAAGRACRAEAGHLEEEEGELAGTVAAVEQQEDDGGRTDEGLLCRIRQRGGVFV